jgi:hypothetical protein
VNTSVKLSIGMLATMVGLVACGRSKTASNNDDFSRDLQMASSTVDLQAPKVDPSNLNLLETQPTSAPQHATVLKKSSGGNKVARSNAPTVHAAPTNEVASTDGMNMTQTADPMPDPVKTDEPVAQAPQPSVISVDPTGGNGTGGDDGDGDYGRSGNGDGGIFGGGSGPIGAVARGGGVDGDNCDPQGGVFGGMPRSTRRPPVYIPNPGGVGTGRTTGGRTATGGTIGRAPSGGQFPGRTTTRRRGQ